MNSADPVTSTVMELARDGVHDSFIFLSSAPQFAGKELGRIASEGTSRIPGLLNSE